MFAKILNNIFMCKRANKNILEIKINTTYLQILFSTLFVVNYSNAQKLFSQNYLSSCDRILSSVEDRTNAQISGGNVPTVVSSINWYRPAIYTSKAAFSGVNGSSASHEGVDYIHKNKSIIEVEILAAADGKVVYVREGCAQSSMYEHNNTTREAGAGWGNHIVLLHKNAIYTRYGHLLKNSIKVINGDSVRAGQVIAVMGNSGRSELRHLHFELGTKSTLFDPCAMSQNFDRVYDSEKLVFNTSTDMKSIEFQTNDIQIYPNPVKEKFHLKLKTLIDSKLNIDLLDLSGKKISNLFEGVVKSNELNLSILQNNKELAQGLYILQICSDNYFKQIKILKTI